MDISSDLKLDICPPDVPEVNFAQIAYSVDENGVAIDLTIELSFAICSDVEVDVQVAAVGGGNAAGLEVIYLSNVAKKVYLIHRRHCMRAEACIADEVDSLENVVPLYNCVIEEAIAKNNKLGALKIKNIETGETSNIDVKALFIAIGVEPQSELARKAGIELDDDNCIKVNKNQETNFQGVYAAGDVTGGIRQVATAVGEATTAAMNAYLYIKQGWYGEGVKK